MISMAYLIAGKLRFNKLYAQPTWNDEEPK
jgi:hypothetical protein